MAAAGIDRFLALLELAINFHRYQVRRECKRADTYFGVSLSPRRALTVQDGRK